MGAASSGIYDVVLPLNCYSYANMPYSLSICIPTYNRADMLCHTIKSILSQCPEDVEIVVSDNASTDGTDILMQSLVQQYSQIHYVRSSVNVGADRNFLRVVELASGRYAWFMGSDDLVAPRGVAEVLQIIESHPELPGFSVNRQMYDFSMTRQLPDMDIFTPRTERVHIHESALSACEDLGIYLSFISGQVFRKDVWSRHALADGIDKYYNGLVHLYVLFAIIRDADTWGAVAAPIVHCRSDNDSFLSAGHFKRFQIDVVGFSDAAGNVFGHSSEIYHLLMKQVLRNLMINRIIGFKLGHVRGVYFKCFVAAFSTCWRYARFWLVFVPVLLLPKVLVQQVLNLRRWVGSNPLI